MAGAGKMGGGIVLALLTFRDLFLLGALVSFVGTVAFWLYVQVIKPKRKLKPVL